MPFIEGEYYTAEYLEEREAGSRIPLRQGTLKARIRGSYQTDFSYDMMVDLAAYDSWCQENHEGWEPPTEKLLREFAGDVYEKWNDAEFSNSDDVDIDYVDNIEVNFEPGSIPVEEQIEPLF